MDELNTFGSLYTQKFLEKMDRDEIKNTGRRAAKLFLLSMTIGAVSNRILTKFKFRNRDFLNLRLAPRLLIRFGIFASCFTFFFYSPMLTHMMKLRQYLNEKYTPRMRLFATEMNPLILNPSMLNEPGMSQEEKEYMKLFLDKMNDQALQARAQRKMEEAERRK
jgi:hypothetical protein